MQKATTAPMVASYNDEFRLESYQATKTREKAVWTSGISGEWSARCGLMHMTRMQM